MIVRHAFGLALTCGSLLLLSACGDDNDAFVPPTNTPTNTARPTNTPTTVVNPPTATNTVVVPTNTPTTPAGGPTDTPTVQGPTNTPTDIPPLTFTPTVTPTLGGASLCGDGTTSGGEQCDDGNNNGADGCAANCTTEQDVTCVFGGATGANVQTGLFAIPLPFTGSQILTAGRSLDTAVETASGADFTAGEVPIALTVSNLRFDPVPVPGLVCACVRGVAQAELGGNAGSGSVGCGPTGLTNTDFSSSVDHNTNAEDPSCANGVADVLHPGICNGRPQTTASGSGPAGSAVIITSTGITLIQDGGLCDTDPAVEGKGPDGIPCNEDDPDQAEPNVIATTTGTATSAILDANNAAGRNIDATARCGGGPCVISSTGSLVPDCALLASDPAAGIVGVKLAGAFAALDAAQIGDNVVTTTFECVAP